MEPFQGSFGRGGSAKTCMTLDEDANRTPINFHESRVPLFLRLNNAARSPRSNGNSPRTFFEHQLTPTSSTSTAPTLGSPVTNFNILEQLNASKRDRELIDDKCCHEARNKNDQEYENTEFHSSMFYLSKGLTVEQTSKISGGKGNKEPVPRQSLHVNTNELLSAHPNVFIDKLYVTSTLMGHNKISQPKVIQSDMSKARVSIGKRLPQSHTIELHFDNIVVTQSSHNNGQKLFIRFTLVDGENEVFLAHVDSAIFQTITRRGKQKRREKSIKSEDCTKRQRMTPTSDYDTPLLSASASISPTFDSNPIDFYMDQTTEIVSVEPSFVSLKGGQIIKIHLVGGIQYMYQPTIPIVILDTNEYAKVLSFDGETILIECPPRCGGFCSVNVSFDNLQSFIENSSCVGLNYIDFDISDETTNIADETGCVMDDLKWNLFP
ncbi:mtnX [Acrasis kona]|uniref:MtnX n=1 Tax=Acrasis kona TaxID=1008807 RepID=A0AAW2Z4J8_9EUKA